MLKVYLAGAGGLGVEYAEGWRNKLEEAFFEELFINPFRANKLREAYKSGSYQGENSFTPNEIVMRDLLDIQRSDVVLAEMRSDDYNYIGTSSEIFYAHSIGKPVVLWTTDKYKLHPWLVHACVKIFTCDDVADACDYIIEQWSE